MEIAFAGEVHPASCDCHKGQFFVFVFELCPYRGRRLIGTKDFKTEADANSAMHETVMSFANEVLSRMGLKHDQAKEIKVRHGEDADKAEMKYRRENNQNLH